ncbi:glutamate racemase [Roseiflexus sp.]|uniref:glutamate racemase n=1 Tax=Roseiflexus sp. TaxID=2562120 RepID=UPI00398BA2F6
MPPIGLFDSGIGGITVLREVRRLLPGEDLLYLADQAHCPYGPRPIDELRAIAATCAAWLIERGAKLIVVACNTASAAALGDLRQRFPETPFVGMVPPVKPAAAHTRSGVVGVLATPTTLEGNLLRDVIEHWANGVRVVPQACHGLVECIEEGALDSPTTVVLLQRYVAPLLDAGADTIVLGCTHYPLVLPQIRALVGDDVHLLDAAPAVAQRVVQVVQERGLAEVPAGMPGSVTYATTGDPQRLARLIERLDLPRGSVIPVTSL